MSDTSQASNPIISRHYMVGLFDVLGFKNKFQALGIEHMTARYSALIDIIVQQNNHHSDLKKFFQFKEGPYWCAGGEIVIMSMVHGAYASDSILIWGNYSWSEFQEKTDDELSELSKKPDCDWLFRPIPCDAFLDTCNELICRSLQVGLPLRGALAVGEAVLDEERNIFLGQPIIDANILEHEQKFIGAGMCGSFLNWTIPARYSLNSASS